MCLVRRGFVFFSGMRYWWVRRWIGSFLQQRLITIVLETLLRNFGRQISRRLGVEAGAKFAVFSTTLVLLWYLGVARMLEILETVERLLLKGLIAIEQSSSL